MSDITYQWRLEQLKHIKKNDLKVFSIFSCGGGSSMGYKLAGYDVVGNCEIDPQMMKLYKANINPKYPYQMDVRQFKKADEYPEELMNLDILDGSPPCSVFSTSGDREEAWGKQKVFREGQAEQMLDDLFFEYLDVVDRLRPKVFVAENVTGIIKGAAKGFVKLIYDHATRIGYDVQLFKLNSATMGVPQRRERVFFIGRRKDLNLPKVQLSFNQKPLHYKEFKSGKGLKLSESSVTYRRWIKRQSKDKNIGDITKRTEGKDSNFNSALLHDNDVPPTIASNSVFIRFNEPYQVSDRDIIHMQSFPQDYDFMNVSVKYVCGMSVPPLMMKGIAEQIAKQMFKK